MRFPRVRFRLRTLLVVVAVTGAGAGGAALTWREAAAVAASLPPEHRPPVWESVRGLGIGLGGLIAFVAVGRCCTES